MNKLSKIIAAFEVFALCVGLGVGVACLREPSSGEIAGPAETDPGFVRITTATGDASTEPGTTAAVITTAPPATVPEGTKMMYLTFDDGPSKNTPKILRILADYGVKATFFVIHHDESYYQQYLIDTLAQGHALALHSYTHDYGRIYSSTSAFWSDLTKLHDEIQQLTGQDIRITRFPGGSSNTVSARYCDGIMTELTEAMESRGYQYFDWNCEDGDADGNTMSTEYIINHARSSANTESEHLVMLCHDTDAKSTTVEALPSIIEYFRDQGYSFGALDFNSYPAHHGVNN